MKNIVLTLLGLIMSLCAWGQEEGYQVKNYNTILSRCQMGNNCAFQDHFGTLWIGNEEGLFSFDGITLLKHTLSPRTFQEYGRNSVLTITEDEDNTLWIGTASGVFFRSSDGFQSLDARSKYQVSISSKVTKIAASGDFVWIATDGQGLFLYNKKSQELSHINQHAAMYMDLCIDGQIVYAATFSGWLVTFSIDGQLIDKIKLEPSLRNKCMVVTPQSIWIGTAQHALFKINKKSKAVSLINLPDASFRNIYSMVTSKTHIILGTDFGAFQIPLEGEGELESLRDKFGDEIFTYENEIRGIAKDRDGGLWLMTYMSGILRISQGGTAIMNIETSNNQMVSALCPDQRQGRIWIGSRNGLYVLDRNAKGLTPIEILHEKHVPMEIRALCKDNDDLWIGLYGNGLMLYNTISKSYKSFPNAPKFINKIFKTHEGEILLATDQGLYLFQKDSESFVHPAQWTNTESVFDIMEDSRHNLWISTANQNVYLRKAGIPSFSLKFAPEIKSNPDIYNTECLCEDTEGNIWIGINDKLYTYNYVEDKFTRFEHPILQNVRKITAIIAGNEQEIWLGTYDGLIRLAPKDSYKCQLFNKASGLEASLISRKCLFLSPVGMMIIGTPQGLSLLNTLSIDENTTTPKTYISDVYFFNKEEDITLEDILGTDNDIRTLDKLRIPDKYNHFLLTLSSSSLENPENNKFAYRIDGLDKDWIELPGNTINISKLTWGTYKLRYKSCNSSSIWEEEENFIWLEVTPPWWRTTWAYLLYTLLFFGLSISGIKKWNSRIKDRYFNTFEKYKTSKEQEFYRAKFQFFTNLVHEIRTPLTLIKLPLDTLQKSGNSDAESLQTIERNVNHLLNITNELLDFQKAETGSITLNPTTTNINELIFESTRIFKQEIKNKGITFNHLIPEEQVTAIIDKAKVSRILINLIGNAIKYAQKEITIQLRATSQELEICIEDDGKGISDNKKESVFRPFFQQDDDRAFLGTGLGLPYSRSIAECHKGTLYAQDSTRYAHGTAMILSLPCHALKETNVVTVKTTKAIDSVDSVHEEDITNKDKKYTVLVVEDNAELRKTVSHSLKNWYTVFTAENGKEALSVLKREAPDVIVTDLMMPEMDGLELCENIKDNEEYAHASVILLTAKITLETKEEGLRKGADVFMEKPFSIAQLHQQIENLIQNRIQFHKRMQKVTTNLGQEEAIDIGINENEYKFINRLNKIITENIKEELNIDILASMLNMSRSSFYRKLKSLSDLTPNDYVRNFRLELAAQMLLQGKQITQVYEETGFKSSSYFSKCFKDKFGILPKDFQKNHLDVAHES